MLVVFFFFQAEDGIRDHCVTGVQTCALPILRPAVGVVLRLPLGFEAGPPLLRAAPLRQTCVRDVERLEAGPTQLLLEIGRASCRERVGVWVVPVPLKEKTYNGDRQRA